VSLSCLSGDREKVSRIYFDILLHPLFSAGKVALRKDQVNEIIGRWNDEPGDIAFREFKRRVFGNSPYAHPVIGEPGTMAHITREDLIAFHRRYFDPSSMIFGVSGDFDKDKMRSLMNAALSRRDVPQSAPRFVPPPSPGRAVYYIDRDTAQAHIIVGNVGTKRDNPDYIALEIMNEILGGGSLSSRLTDRIRVQKGLAYYVASGIDADRESGLFYAICQTREDAAISALRDILDEFERIRSVPVSERELEQAKEAYVNSFVFNFTTPALVVRQMVLIRFFGLPEDYLSRYVERVAAVTREDILRVARRYVLPAEAVILVLGDREKFSGPLDEFGEVHTIEEY
jgi:predicted Zn-dependent peptidase